MCVCVLTRIAQINCYAACTDLLMNSVHKPKTSSVWPSLLGLQVIIENAYVAVLPAEPNSQWAAC